MSHTDECAICLCVIDSVHVKTLSCKHSFHKACIEKWSDSQNTCPCCRKKIRDSVLSLVDVRGSAEEISGSLRVLDDDGGLDLSIRELVNLHLALDKVKRERRMS